MGQLITWLVPYQFSHDVSEWWNAVHSDYANNKQPLFPYYGITLKVDTALSAFGPIIKSTVWLITQENFGHCWLMELLLCLNGCCIFALMFRHFTSLALSAPNRCRLQSDGNIHRVVHHTAGVRQLQTLPFPQLGVPTKGILDSVSQFFTVLYW